MNTIWSGVVYDSTKAYRYALWRMWDERRPRLLFILQYPTCADDPGIDPAFRRCREWARSMNFGSLTIGCIFARRARFFHEVERAGDPVGAENDAWLVRLHTEASQTIVAWGKVGSHLDRGRQVMALLMPIKPAYCLGTTKTGQPRHPAYLNSNLRPESFPGIPPERVWCGRCQAFIATAESVAEARERRAEHNASTHPIADSPRGRKVADTSDEAAAGGE